MTPIEIRREPVMRDDSESGDDIVFLTPEGNPVPEQPDQGASPPPEEISKEKKINDRIGNAQGVELEEEEELDGK